MKTTHNGKAIEWELLPYPSKVENYSAINATTTDGDPLMFTCLYNGSGALTDCTIGFTGASNEGISLEDIPMSSRAVELFGTPEKACTALVDFFLLHGLVIIQTEYT